MDEHKNKQTVFYSEIHGKQFNQWISEILNNTPEEVKSELIIETNYEDNYGDNLANVHVYYMRNETDIEKQARERNEGNARMFAEQKEREQFELLKAKYGAN